MKIYQLDYFDASEWARMTAEVVAESPDHAKELLLGSYDIFVHKRGYDGNDSQKAPTEERKEWIKVVGERNLPIQGVLSVRHSNRSSCDCH